MRRTGFYLGILLMFVMAELFAGWHRFYVPVFELVVIWGMSYFSAICVNKHCLKLLLNICVYVYLCIYILQCFYYDEMGEFIPVLALQNYECAYLMIRGGYIAAIIGVMVIIYVYHKYVRIEAFKKMGFLTKGAVVISFILVLIQNQLLFTGYINNGSIKSFRQETPGLGFLMNVWHAFFQDQGYGETIDSFPFERDETYGNELPYSSKCQSAESKPNIIIIFTEGTSSRLLGCYNPVYSDLTPNIDAFAKNSMVVKNYYNHTAATFRGTQGQLTSCYPFRGGAGKCGWNNTAGLLSKGCYKSLPQMLNKNYHTVFISPHKEADPYTGLIKSLGFKGLYTRDSVNELLDYEPGWENESVKDEDMYNALIGFLEHYDEKQPFMLAMYTFGTHTDLDVPVDGKHFMNGDNSVLNTLYNDDAAFGQFWEYFSHSKFAKNTIVIFTADHTHYHDKPFMKLMDNEKDYTKCFIDRIPLIIYDPIHDLPSSYDANDKTSISLAPTVCQLLKVKKEKNSFMGNSIFDEDGINEHIAAIGDSFYVIQNHKVCEEKYFYDSDGNAKRMIDDIWMFYKCEKNNHVYKADDCQ